VPRVVADFFYGAFSISPRWLAGRGRGNRTHCSAPFLRRARALRGPGGSGHSTAQVGTAASGVAEAGSELATSAKEHAKTLASELETMARRNPLGALAGALFVGVIIGMMSRGRD
jgi:hypothetical protein